MLKGDLCIKKIKELDNFELPEKTFEERKNDLMNWFYIALRMCLRFLKMYLNEKRFEEFFECEKQIASYCEKFRRTIGAIKNQEMRKIIKDEINKAFEKEENDFSVLEDLPSID